MPSLRHFIQMNLLRSPTGDRAPGGAIGVDTPYDITHYIK